MKRVKKASGLTLSLLLLISAILSVLVIPLPIAKAAPTYSWATFTIASSGDDVETLAKTGFSNFTTDGNNLWVHSDEYTTYAWLRFEGLGSITNAGGIIDQIILSMYSGADEGADYTEVTGGYVSVACPMFSWDFELTEENILAADMNPVASFDGDNLSPSGVWYNKTISNNDPRDWYAWSIDFNDVFTCYVAGFMQYSPEWTYYRSFTSFDEGHPAKLYVKYHIGEGYEEVLAEFGVDSATYNHSWNNYNIWGIYESTALEIGYIFAHYDGGEYFAYYDDLEGSGPYLIESTGSISGTHTGGQRHLVKTGGGKLYAVFQGEPGAKTQIYIKESADDGVTWTNKVRLNSIDGMDVVDFFTPSITLDSSDNLHVVFWGLAPFEEIYYTNYTGSWSTPLEISTAPASGAQEYPSIAIDSNGVLHTTWEGFSTSQIFYANYTGSGSWSTPLEICTEANMTGQRQSYPSISIDSDDHIHIAWMGYTNEHPTNIQIWYKERTTTWGSFSRVSVKATMENYIQAGPCIAIDPDDFPHVVWHGKPGTQSQIWHSSYNETHWQDPTLLSTDGVSGARVNDGANLIIDSNSTRYVMWDDNVGPEIWLTTYTDGWNAPTIEQTTAVVDQTPNMIFPLGVIAENMTYVATAPNGTVITPDPFDDLDDLIDFLEDWDEDYGPILAISIANIDAGEWVFEGNKRYEFTVNYINVNLTDVEQVGVGFTDETNRFHSVWYDRDANTLTVTSPEDSISGWLHSIEEVGAVHTGINVTAVFHIMFNSPIPDSYDVSAYGRIVDTADSGWVTPKWGESGESGELYLFNIYNLGGLSTLTASGTAGRVTGGDIFEIYAADTRTNIAGTQYFDVRDDPLSWYNVLTNEDLLINEMPPDWDFNIPRRTQSITIRLTNNLPEDREAPQARDYVTPGTDDMAYVSYPFGMRLLSDPFLTGDYQIDAELTLPRNLTSDDGILWVQAYMMNPNTTTTTGAFWVRDGPRLESGSLILSDVQFNGNGSWVSYNSTASEWIYYEAYEAYTWYNVTVAINLTSAVYDIYIDSVEVVSNLPYRNPAASTAYIVAFSQFVPIAGAPDDAFLDFYVDNVRQWTDFDADYGGIAKATMLFKQLQHWSMDFDFFIENGKEYAQGPTATPALASDDYSDHGYLEFGWDIMLNETWINDFLVARVNITDGQISGKNDWVKFNVTWYSQGIYVKNDFLYGLFEGYSIFPGSSKDTTGFHWDIWFNRANASTLVGARLNTEYFGMSDKSVWWAVWSSKWQPMRTEVSDSTIFVDLEDADSKIHSAKDVLFVRSHVKVYRTSDSTFAYKVLNIGGLDFLEAVDTMSGIDTPPVRETNVPDVVSGFLGSALGSIFSAALKRLGNTLAGFGMEFFTMSIAFIDNVFAALGYPALVSTIFGWMDSLFSSVPILVGYGITLIGEIFLLINTSAGDILNQLTGIITIWIGMYSTTMDFFTGVLTPGINLWNDLGINSFIQIGAILYPLWLLMMGMEKGWQAVFDHLNGVLSIGSFFLNFILNVAGFFMGLMDMLIGAIRG